MQILMYYAHKYHSRFGKDPEKNDLDPTLANTLIRMCGSPDEAGRLLDAWFDSSDTACEEHGFQFANCLDAKNRLFATGEWHPKEGMASPKLEELTRRLAAAMFFEPRPRPTK